MRIKAFRVHTIAVLLGAGAIAGLGMATAGEAAAAPTTCVAANGHQVEHVSGLSGCGAKASPGSRASAYEESGHGTAVAVAESGGTATARNTQPGSSALSSAETGGTSYSVTTGPKAISVAQARRGGTTVALGGFGGQAYAGKYGAACSGGFAIAGDSTSGKGCLRWGTINVHN